ncbi:unnamed protein product, partial [Rotaria sp. Silwood2]
MSYILVFQVKPNVESLNPTNQLSCVIGQDTQLTWKFTGIEKPHVSWLFNEQTLQKNDRFQVTESNDGTSTLSIRNANFVDSGIYTARATNSVGEAEAKTTLSVVGIKPVIKIDLNEQLKVVKGERVILNLVAFGTPKPEIVWMKGYSQVTSNNRI